MSSTLGHIFISERMKISIDLIKHFICKTNQRISNQSLIDPIIFTVIYWYGHGIFTHTQNEKLK